MRGIIGAGLVVGTGFAVLVARADSLPPSASYRPLPTIPFETVKTNDEAEKPQVMQRQLLSSLYDLSDHPISATSLGVS
jgi:hypothetical protein